MTRLVHLGDVATITQGMNVPSQKEETRLRLAGARKGDWQVKVASVGDIQDDRLDLGNLGTVGMEWNAKTEKHLLQPDDVLVSARSTIVKAALVPPPSVRVVADATLLVVRARETDLGPYLWWYLTSALGRRQVYARMKGSTTLLFLAARSLAEIELPVPEGMELNEISSLVETSERAYRAATEAAQLRRTIFRDAVIDRLQWTARDEEVGEWR